MERDGYSATAVRKAGATVRSCLDRLETAGADIDGIDAGIMTVLDRCLEGCAPSTRKYYLRTFGRYLNHCAGRTVVLPMMDNDKKSRIPARYEAPLQAWLDGLTSGGTSDGMVREDRQCVVHCFRLLWPEYGDLDPSDVDGEVYARLADMMEGLTGHARRKYLSAFGLFIASVTGRDPYREETRSKLQSDFPSYVAETFAASRYREEVLDYVRHMMETGYRRTTVQNYVRGVKQSLDRMERVAPGTSLEDVDKDLVVRIRMTMTGLGTATVRSYLVAFCEFVEFVTGHKCYDPRRLKLNESEAKRVFISKDDWARLREVASVEENLILALGAGMGLRRAEIAGIRLDDIAGDMMTIRGKGHGPEGKVAVKRIPKSVQKAIESYLSDRTRILERYGDKSDGHLLVRATVHRGEAMTPAAVGYIVHKLAVRSGVEVTPHSLRRFYATTLYDGGTDLNDLRQMMRHASIDTTLRCYIQPNARRIATAEAMLEAEIFSRREDRTMGTKRMKKISVTGPCKDAVTENVTGAGRPVVVEPRPPDQVVHLTGHQGIF